MNDYEVLGIPSNASDDDIKRAYRNLAKRWHPDANKSPEAESKFKEINRAYENLTKEKPFNPFIDPFFRFRGFDFSNVRVQSSTITLNIDNLTQANAEKIADILRRNGYIVNGYTISIVRRV